MNAIDELEYDFEILSDEKKYDFTNKPEDGCYLYGFYIEGGSWNFKTKTIDDPIPKVLYPAMPKIWFIPKHTKGKLVKKDVNFIFI